MRTSRPFIDFELLEVCKLVEIGVTHLKIGKDHFGNVVAHYAKLLTDKKGILGYKKRTKA